MKKSNVLLSRLLVVIMTINILLANNGFDSRAASGRNQNVINAINNYVNGLNGSYPVSYKGKASGCFAFVNYVWKNVFGVDYYDGQYDKNSTSGKSNDLYKFLRENNAKSGDIVWAHNSEGVTHNFIILDYSSSSIEITDGTSSGTIWHNDKQLQLNTSSSFYNKYLYGNCIFTIYKIKESYWSKVAGQAAPKTNVTLDPSTYRMGKGAMTRFFPKVERDGVITSDVTWSSSDSNIVAVDSNGYIYANNIGVATITATADDGASASCVVTVVNSLEYVKTYLEEPSIDLENGKFVITYGYKNYRRPDNGYLTTEGRVKYVMPNGTEKDIPLKSEGSLSKVHGLKLEYASVDVEIEVSCDISTNNNARGKYYYTLDFVFVNTNDSTKTVMASYDKTIDMGVRVEDVAFNESSSKLKVGETLTTSININPENAYDKQVSYSSSDEKVATVSENGVITAHSAGTADIVVVSHDGVLSDTILVTVYDTNTGTESNSGSNNSNSNANAQSDQNSSSASQKNDAVDSTNDAQKAETVSEKVDDTVKVVKIKSLKAAKKKFTVTFKKASSIDGYEVQYDTSKKFSSAKSKTLGAKKTNVTVKKLKPKTTYFVRMRSFKNTDNGKVYSNWSKIKKVRVK
ncbi:Fibronectin type III domain-containing protein [Butyrivibrio sp. ob235]|uniref:Ig-like domain-containing protein n=1 Tax=Butyrivibrio sp. ob235 TaxID=1761780 RepID=UPI0008CDC8B5|nr:Ig-like domain-containing protein [Butyrivibrio sp. ob235]SEM11825.1 Fibronectin type III domain-containing protein [Butyrivibrio sp. ob235]